MKSPAIISKISQVGGVKMAVSMLSAKKSLEHLVIERFLRTEVGRQYGLSRKDKINLVRRFKRNTRSIQTATTWLSHVVLAESILLIPKNRKGDVIECGCFKGSSTASLSLICAAAKRRLIVADSFEGLPPDSKNTLAVYSHLAQTGVYEKGMYSATLEEVKDNIARFGDISVCDFLPGFFSKSLRGLKRQLVFAFLDVDLASSMKDCLKFIWPFLIDGSYLYTDDSCDMEVIKVWFDKTWWRKLCQCSPPGYVGSGCGLPIDISHTGLGYTRKVKLAKDYQRVILGENKKEERE